MFMDDFPKQSQLNIGTLGHVDHGKTTLTYAITHVWTDVHSESIKRSMTIKLGYSDAVIYLCGDAAGAAAYTTSEKCKNGKPSRPVRRISLLDAPGHETLMATAIAGSNIIDAALFVIAATEPCPMAQTKEHLMLINALGIKKVIVVQTKVDIVGREQALKHHAQITNFLKGSSIEDAVLEAIAKIEMPVRDTTSEPSMYVARSFDVNRPGTKTKDLRGGVVGGSIIRGKFKVGDEIEIRPGINASKEKQKREVYTPIITKIESLLAGKDELDEAIAGGLIAVGTGLDPSLTKADALVGQVVGRAGKLPECVNDIEIKYSSLDRSDLPKQAFRPNEPLLLGIGTGTNVGYVKTAKKGALGIELRHPACIDRNTKISILRNFSQRWHLSGYGTPA